MDRQWFAGMLYLRKRRQVAVNGEFLENTYFLRDGRRIRIIVTEL